MSRGAARGARSRLIEAIKLKINHWFETQPTTISHIYIHQLLFIYTKISLTGLVNGLVLL